MLTKHTVVVEFQQGLFIGRHSETNSKAKGITLVELLIVIASVLILAGVALPSWNSQVRKGDAATPEIP